MHEPRGGPVRDETVTTRRTDEDAVAAAVERVIADDEAMSRARYAYLNSPPYGTKHGHAARLEHMRAAFRAAFGAR